MHEIEWVYINNKSDLIVLLHGPPHGTPAKFFFATRVGTRRSPKIKQNISSNLYPTLAPQNMVLVTCELKKLI